jgi:hypothetical protein
MLNIYLSDSKAPLGPSSSLIQKLLSLSAAIQRLGVSRGPSRDGTLASHALRHFVAVILKDGGGLTTGGLHSLWDLAFLRKLVGTWNELEDISGILEERSAQVRRTVRH